MSVYDDKFSSDCSLKTDETCKILIHFMKRSKNVFLQFVLKIMLVLRGCNIDDGPDDVPDPK